MSTPAASTKSLNSTSPEAQNATSNNVNGTNDPQQQQNGGAEQGQSNTEPEGGYPPQRHAGAVGLGPEYGKNQGVTTGDKLTGFKEEIAGKITRNHDKVEHGKELRTGELKKKQQEEDEKNNPFQSVDDDEKKAGNKDETVAQPKGGEPNPDNSGRDDIAGNAAGTTATGKRGPGTHPTEAGAQEQAATTAPEGTKEAEAQRQGGNVDAQRQIDERN